MTILIVSANSIAQQITWNHMGGPMGGIVGDLGINSQGHVYAGVYSYRGLYRSTTNGETWQKIQTQFEDFEVYAIYFTAEGYIFVGTNFQGRIYRSTDDGQTWENTRTGYNTGECWAFGQSRDGVLFAGDGQYGGTYRSTHYGNNWEFSANLYPLVFATDTTSSVVYCGSFLGLFGTTDNGLTWSQNSFLANVPVSTILTDSNGGIYCGTGYYNNGNGVFYSPDRGGTWTQLGLAGKVVLSLAFDSHRNLYAGTLNDGLYRTTDHGQTWTRYTNGLYRKQVFRLKLNAQDGIFVGSENEGVFRSTDGGGSFRQVGLPISRVNNIVFSGDSLIIAATPSGVQCYNRILHEWRNVGLQNVEAVAISPVGELYAGTFDAGLFRSSDYGTMWTLTNLTADSLFSVYNVGVLFDGAVFAATERNLRRSTDHGNTWTVLSPRTSSFRRGIAVGADTSVWVAAFGLANTVLFKSTDNGASFDSVFSGFREVDRNGIEVLQSGLVFLADANGSFGGIYRSTDGGSSWQKVIGTPVRCVFAEDQGWVYAGAEDSLLVSLDNGNTFAGIRYPFASGRVFEIAQDSKGTMFFGTSADGLYQVDVITSLQEKNDKLLPPSSLEQSFPNPFNSSTEIRFQIRDPGWVVLRVFDILGREVATLVDEPKNPGRYTVTWYTREFPSGVYFYRLQVGIFEEAKKLILLR